MWVKIFVLLVNFGTLSFFVNSQTIPAGFPVLEEAVRRNQLLGDSSVARSFGLRPFELNSLEIIPSLEKLNHVSPSTDSKKAVEKYFRYTPFRQTVAFNSKRPYGWGNGPMVPNVGLQSYTQGGIYAKFLVFNLQLVPELVWTQNKPYQGFEFRDPRIASFRYRYWSFGDYPERFGEGPSTLIWWGQSKFTIQAGFLEAGVSAENIWWGPGQFSSLTFSNNARSFPHLTLRSRRPAQTFMGTFEGEVIVGRLEDSGIEPAQIDELNEVYFFPFSGDYKYLNAITITYQPRWVQGLFVGFSRTHQQYSQQMGRSWGDYLPIFEPFQKTIYGFDRDSEGRDQQFTFFGRWVIPKAKMELYFEYGRRDHAYDWREAILNPEHARAYLMGFNKLWETGKPDQLIQIRAEMLHQQESINRIIRYPGLGGGYSWHTHGQARGFTNYGEALGTGPGVGSNVQSLEVSAVNKLNKKGLLFERLANHQDFFYRSFGRNSAKKPWIDYSLGLLWDHQWDQLIISGKAQLIQATNYQWQDEGISTRDFHSGFNPISFFGQIHLIYIFKK